MEDICQRYRITLNYDEVFVGFGRTDKMFGHQHYGGRSKIMTFAKAIGGGVPIGGFCATEDVGDVFEKGDHFSTFGMNNQIGLAAAHAVLDVESSRSGASRRRPPYRRPSGASQTSWIYRRCA
jgi:acetylornithine/succinyldiaminopimelate/putrescine aminotransferase